MQSDVVGIGGVSGGDGILCGPIEFDETEVLAARREAAAVGVDAAYGLADVSRDALVALAERVARRWGR